MERQEPDRHKLGRAKFIEKRVGLEGRERRHHHQPAQAPRRLLRLVARALHHGRGPVARPSSRCSSISTTQGLIYRDKRLVNWDPEFQSALSNLEVEMNEEKGSLWHFRYPLADGQTYRYPIAFDDDGRPTDWDSRDYIVVATTRPETMLGDTAVAVHPEDERYQALVGKTRRAALGRARDPHRRRQYADPKKGSGAVKITPAHDFNDYQVGKRHPEIGLINILDAKAQLNDEVPETVSRARPLRRPQAGDRRPGGAGPARQDRAAPCTPSRTPSAATPSSSRG